MKNLVVLGAGTAGTMAVNKVRTQLPRDEWRITIVDLDPVHLYQPGLLFVPFGTYDPADIVRPKESVLHDGIDLIIGEVDRVDPDEQRVMLMDGSVLVYDYLVIASGTTPRPDQTPGMDDPAVWRSDVHEFYTLEGAIALRSA